MTCTPRVLIRSTLSVVAVVATAGLAQAGAAPGNLFAKTKRAFVEILVNDRHAGSGWIADSAGWAVTCAHVIGKPGQRVELLHDGKRLEARVAAVDIGNDLALLRLAKREAPYPHLALADKLPPPGADIYLLGAPMYRPPVLQNGMVGSDRTTFEFYTDRGHYVEVLHVSAKVQKGVSGGPWVNEQGMVVGVQSGSLLYQGSPAGIADVIPAERVRRLLKSRESATTPTLGVGIEETWQQSADYLRRLPPRTEGLVVRILKQGGPAARAGVKQWDVIVRVDGSRVRRVNEVLKSIRKKRPTESVELTLSSPDGAGERRVAIKLGQLEVGWPDSTKPAR